MKRMVSLSLGLAFLAISAAPQVAGAADGEKLFQDKGCTDCHYTTGPAKEKTIADKLAMKGPELWYAGDKFQAKWLGKWLQDPKPIRPLQFNTFDKPNPADHPKLSAGDAAAVSAFLMSKTSGKLQKVKIKPKKNPKGKQLFTKKMPCSGCHQYPKKKAVVGGLSAPSLVGAKSRLNPAWIYSYLVDPATYKPVKMMPVFTGLMSDKDMKKLSAHVANFK
jgi:cytochrome c553